METGKWQRFAFEGVDCTMIGGLAGGANGDWVSGMRYEDRRGIWRRTNATGKLLARWWLRVVVLGIACMAMVARADQGYLQYTRSLAVKEKDADFITYLDVTIYFGTRENGGQRIMAHRGPIEIFGALGKTKTFLGARLQCDLTPEEAQEIQHVLDALELQNLPEKDDSSADVPDSYKHPGVFISYKDIIRGAHLTPDASLARKLDETIETLLKKIAGDPGSMRYWQPQQKTFAGDDQPAEAVTFAQLVDDPIRYHGRRVRVTGYYTAGFEDSSLWADAETVWKSEKRLWVAGTSKFADKKHLDHKATAGKQLVTIEGTFDAGGHGHMGLYRGEIERATRFTLANGETRKGK